MKMKFCVWLGADGRAVKHCYADQAEMTLPEPGLPVWIVAFNEDGSIEQCDLYHHDGYKIFGGPGMVAIVSGTDTEFIVKP